MTKRNELPTSVLTEQLEPTLLGVGFSRVSSSRWRPNGFEVRAVIDSKATDPFRGGAFTLELELSDDGHFEAKIAGRVRLHQLLDTDEARRFLELSE